MTPSDKRSVETGALINGTIGAWAVTSAPGESAVDLDMMNETRRAWSTVAASLPSVIRWRILRQIGFGIVALPGLYELVVLVRWAASWASPSWSLGVVIGMHIGAIAIAVGPTIRLTASDDAQSTLVRITNRYGNRLARLVALRRALCAEVLVLLVATVARTVLEGAPFQIQASLTTAIATLWVVWPAERIALAQRAEGVRLREKQG